MPLARRAGLKVVGSGGVASLVGKRRCEESDPLERLAYVYDLLTEQALGGASAEELMSALRRILRLNVTLQLIPAGPSPTVSRGEVKSQDGQGTDISEIPVAHDGVLLGHIHVSGQPETSDPIVAVALHGAARLIVMVLLKETSRTRDHQAIRELTLLDLLGGALCSEDLPKKSAEVGCDLLRPECLFVVENRQPGSRSVDRKGHSAQYQAVQASVVGLPSLVCEWQTDIVVLITRPFCSSGAVGCLDGRSEGQGHSRSLSGVELVSPPSSDLPDLLDRFGAETLIGLARASHGLTDARALCAEARDLMRLARRLGKDRGVASTDDPEIEVYRLLERGHDEERARGFVTKVLGSLVAHDRRRRGALVSTLDAYLDNNGSVEATAESMYVHVSTLKYRLSKISQLSGLDLRSSGDRFRAQLALKHRRLLQHPSSSDLDENPVDF